METFTASNGLVLVPHRDGSVRWEAGFSPSVVTAALREFFRHERDQELGRWRWPENHDYVVYPSDQFAAGAIYSWVRVMHERTSLAEGFARVAIDRTTRPNMEFVKAARAYFAAHPEPRPWHGAKPGEVWVLSVDGSEDMVMTVHESNYGGFRFRLNDGEGTIYALDTPAIRAGRRIWPEVSDG